LLFLAAKAGKDVRPLFEEIGLFLQSQIKLRTAEGLDVEGRKFKPYSTRHAAKRKSLGLPIDKVDLFFTGSMLSSMNHEAAQSQVRVFFMPTTDKFGGSNPAKAFYINEGQGREFFAISSKEADDILNLAARRLVQILNTPTGGQTSG
jgi:hypothetical protein